jgi:hypothetical protein
VPGVAAHVADYVFRSLSPDTAVANIAMVAGTELGDSGDLIHDAALAYLYRNAVDVGPSRLAGLPLPLQAKVLTADEAWLPSEWARYRLAVAVKRATKARLLGEMSAAGADDAVAALRRLTALQLGGGGSGGGDASASEEAGVVSGSTAGGDDGGDDGSSGVDAELLRMLAESTQRLERLFGRRQQQQRLNGNDDADAGAVGGSNGVFRLSRRRGGIAVAPLPYGTGNGGGRSARRLPPSLAAALAGSSEGGGSGNGGAADPYESGYTRAPPPSPSAGAAAATAAAFASAGGDVGASAAAIWERLMSRGAGDGSSSASSASGDDDGEGAAPAGLPSAARRLVAGAARLREMTEYLGTANRCLTGLLASARARGLHAQSLAAPSGGGIGGGGGGSRHLSMLPSAAPLDVYRRLSAAAGARGSLAASPAATTAAGAQARVAPAADAAVRWHPATTTPPSAGSSDEGDSTPSRPIWTTSVSTSSGSQLGGSGESGSQQQLRIHQSHAATHTAVGGSGGGEVSPRLPVGASAATVTRLARVVATAAASQASVDGSAASSDPSCDGGSGASAESLAPPSASGSSGSALPLSSSPLTASPFAATGDAAAAAVPARFALGSHAHDGSHARTSAAPAGGVIDYTAAPSASSDAAVTVRALFARARREADEQQRRRAAPLPQPASLHSHLFGDGSDGLGGDGTSGDAVTAAARLRRDRAAAGGTTTGSGAGAAPRSPVYPQPRDVLSLTGGYHGAAPALQPPPVPSATSMPGLLAQAPHARVRMLLSRGGSGSGSSHERVSVSSAPPCIATPTAGPSQGSTSSGGGGGGLLRFPSPLAAHGRRLGPARGGGAGLGTRTTVSLSTHNHAGSGGGGGGGGGVGSMPPSAASAAGGSHPRFSDDSRFDGATAGAVPTTTGGGGGSGTQRVAVSTAGLALLASYASGSSVGERDGGGGAASARVHTRRGTAASGASVGAHPLLLVAPPAALAVTPQHAFAVRTATLGDDDVVPAASRPHADDGCAARPVRAGSSAESSASAGVTAASSGGSGSGSSGDSSSVGVHSRLPPQPQAQRDFASELAAIDATYDAVFAQLRLLHLTEAQLAEVAADGEVPPPVLADALAARAAMHARLARARAHNVKKLSELPPTVAAAEGAAAAASASAAATGAAWPPLRFGVEVGDLVTDAMAPTDDLPAVTLSSDRVLALGSLWSLVRAVQGAGSRQRHW